MISRRHVVLALGAGALAPFGAFAQQPGGMHRIGYLSLSPSAVAKPLQQTIGEQLRRAGYEEGRNLIIEWRFAEGKTELLPQLAEDLVRRGVELIVAQGNYAITAAMHSTSTIPILMFGGIAPVEMGLIRTLSHPGGNVTGTTYNSPETAGKVLEVLHDAFPKARRVALLWNPALTGIRLFAAETDRAAKALSMVVQYFDATRSEEIIAALPRIAASRPDALYVVNDPLISTRLTEIAAFAHERKLPSIGVGAAWVAAGGLLYYGPDFQGIAERTISYVERILSGVKPADLPVEQPTKFEMIVNLKTAKALGIKISNSVLTQATKVIE